MNSADKLRSIPTERVVEVRDMYEIGSPEREALNRELAARRMNLTAEEFNAVQDGWSYSVTTAYRVSIKDGSRAYSKMTLTADQMGTVEHYRTGGRGRVWEEVRVARVHPHHVTSDAPRNRTRMVVEVTA